MDTPTVILLIVLALLWIAAAFFAHWLGGVKVRDPHDPAVQAFFRLFQVYAARFHQLQASGTEHIPQRNWDTHPTGRTVDLSDVGDRPIIVVANHTAGVDPVLVQACCPFEIRWMMAQDMRAPALEWLWQYGKLIFVDRDSNDPAAVREALRHLKNGGTIGIFAEGHIERPPRHLMPMKAGIGLMVKKSKALVVPVVIDGTPQIDPAWNSLWTQSQSSVRFLPVMDFAADADGKAMKAGDITASLQRVFEEATGWPMAPRLPKVVDGELWTVGVDGQYRRPDGTVVEEEANRS